MPSFFPPQGGGTASGNFPITGTGTLSLSQQLSTSVRYVSPSGNDTYDGKSWNTAKATILSAYDDLPGGSDTGLIYIQSGSYVGGEVASQGLWLYRAQVTDFDVNNGDSVVASSHTWTFANGQFSAGFVGGKLVVTGATHSQNNGTFTITSVTSPTVIVTSGTQVNETFTGPSVTAVGTQVAPSGWRTQKFCTFQGVGGPVAQFTPNGAEIFRGQPGDSQTWDLTKPTLWISGGGNLFFNNLQPGTPGFGFAKLGIDWTGDRSALMSSVFFNACTMASLPTSTSPYTTTGPAWDCGWINIVYFTDCAAYGGVNVSDPNDPLLNSDQAAGWLIRPNDPVDNIPGSVGAAYWTNCHPVLSGIKNYVGATGFSLTIDTLLQENGPAPYPVNIAVLPGTDITLIPFTISNLTMRQISGADRGSQTDTNLVHIDSSTWKSLQVGNIIADTVYGTVDGPCLFSGQNNRFARTQKTTPWFQSQLGTFYGGRMSGQTDAGRRIGSAAAVPYPNLCSHDPSTWTTIGSPVITTGQVDPFGGTNAAKITGTFNVDAMLLYDGTAGGKAITLMDGDIVVSGVWVRGASYQGLDTPVTKVVTPTGSFTTVWPASNGQSPQVGNGEWQWVNWAGVYTTPGGVPVSEAIVFIANPGGFGLQRFAYPLFFVLKNARQTPLHNASDAVVASTGTWHFVNGAFTPDYVGGTLVVTGASNTGNNGTFTILTVPDSTHVTTATTGLGNETFGSGVVAVLTNPNGFQATEAWEMLAHGAAWNPIAAQGMVATLRGQKLLGDSGIAWGPTARYTVGVASGNITLGSATGKAVQCFDEAGNSLGVVAPLNFTVNP